MDGYVAALHHGADAGREFVAAVIAQEHAGLRLAGHAVDIERAAIGAKRAVGPARRLKVRQRLLFIVKDGISDVDGH